jgi:hypothetical protein
MGRVENMIRESWFPDHKATLTQHGDLQVLQWAKPHTNNYSCRYVFDGNKMYISGDIGEAVFWLTWRANIHSFNDIHVNYFEEKLAAYSGERRNYSGEEVAKRLREWKDELNEVGADFNNDEFEDLIHEAEHCSSKHEWTYEVVNGRCHEFIKELDYDYWEWIYDIGDVMPPRIIGYLIGLKMASEQLNEEQPDILIHEERGE